MTIVVIGIVFLIFPPRVNCLNPKRVLILYSFDKEETFHFGLDQQVRATLRSGSSVPVEVYTEYLDLAQFGGHSHEDELFDLVSVRCNAITPDAIVAVAYPALNMLLKYSDELCPEVPVVFSYVDEERIPEIQKRTRKLRPERTVAGITTKPTIGHTLRVAIQLQPKVQAAYIVVGNSTFERFWLQEVRSTIADSIPNLKVKFLNNLAVSDLIRKASTLPPNSIIFFAFFGRDISGQFFSSEEVLELLRERANAPIYSIYLPYVGHGIVGGSLTDPKVVGEETGKMVLRVIDNKDTSEAKIVPSSPAVGTFDWRELNRWRIPRHRLPQGSRLLFQEPSVWARYRQSILGLFLLFGATTTVIVWLLVLYRKQRQTVARARRLEAQWHSVFENAPIGILLYELFQDRVLSANPAAVHMLGYDSEKELQSLTFSQLICPGSIGAGPLAVRLTGQESADLLEVKLQRKDKRPISVKIRRGTIRKEISGDVMELIVEDITSQRLLEAEFHHAQKLEAVGRLAGGIAHDFNNLLGVIIGGAAALTEKLGLCDPLAATADAIHKAGLSAARLTSRLLTFSRKRVPQRTAVSINSVLAEAESMLSHVIGEDIEFEVALAPEDGTIEADPAEISNVIMNLAVNSRDAMPGGGRLTIAAEQINLPGGSVQNGAALGAGRYVKLQVTDTGTGMDEETKARIFEPFFTTKPVDQGTGLGLAVVYGVVKEAGGSICVSSVPGKGSTFELYFPLHVSTSRLQVVAAAETVLRKGTETILLVEDSLLLQSFISEGLKEDGYHVLVASNGEQALQVALRSSMSIDLLVTDVRMPEMSGPQLARKLEQRVPGLKVLYMSGYADDLLDQSVGSGKGTANLIKKPFDIPALERRIREILTCNESIA